MSQLIEELAKKRKNWVAASKENNFEEGLKRLLTDLYPDNAHFIYELLQNAEDSGASVVRFLLTDKEIEFEHNSKRLFDIRDVESITSICASSKRDDPTAIGKFGVGFKAVFAYTNTPEIHSGSFHFRIHDLVVPEIDGVMKPVMDKQTTRFVFPFDHPTKYPTQSVEEIERGLRVLNDNTLLFLNHINTIEYLLPDGSLGSLNRVNHKNGHIEIRSRHPGGQDIASHWLRFQKEVEVRDDCTVNTCKIAIAYSLMEEDETKKSLKKWKIVPLDHGQVSIYFPADKETSKLRFHLHAPFASTVARDSVRDCAGNNILRNHLAELLAESMHEIRDQGLLSVQSLALLPNDKDNLNDFYKPIMIRLVEEFKASDLVPMKRGGYAAASGIFSGQRALSDLIDDDDLVILLADNYFSPMWVANPSQRNQREDNFLSMLDIKQWTIADLVKLLGEMIEDVRAEWMNNKDEKWHQELYELLMEYLKSAPKFLSTEAKERKDSIKDITLVRCSDGTYRKGCECYFSTEEIFDALFPQVEKRVYTIDNCVNKIVYDFLEMIGVREIDSLAIVERVILPKYASKSAMITFPEHIRDIATIEKAYSTEYREKKILLQKLLLVTPFILIENKNNGNITYKKPSGLYFKTNDLRLYFSDNVDFFVSSKYPDSVMAFFKELGVSDFVRIRRKEKYGQQGRVIIEDSHGSHKRGINGFDPDIYVDRLENALVSPTIKKSSFIWNNIAIPHSDCIRGVIESSSTREFCNLTKKDCVSHFGSFLIDTQWLPDKNGMWRKPADLFLLDLPKEFDSTSVQAREVAEKLGMKKPEEAKAADTLSKGNPRKKELLERIANASDDELERFEKLVPKEILPVPVQSFKEGITNMHRPQRGTISGQQGTGEGGQSYSVKNPDRYQNNLDEDAANAVEEHLKTPQFISFSPARDKAGNKESRNFLYKEYQGRCQISGATFPKASINAEGESENYFEACCLLSSINASYFNDAGNMLGISADTMAKLKHASFEWLEDIHDKIAEFEGSGSRAQKVSIKIKLAGEECTITWSQRHFMRLISLYKEA